MISRRFRIALIGWLTLLMLAAPALAQMAR